jgi:hypothetical protein
MTGRRRATQAARTRLGLVAFVVGPFVMEGRYAIGGNAGRAK